MECVAVKPNHSLWQQTNNLLGLLQDVSFKKKNVDLKHSQTVYTFFVLDNFLSNSITIMRDKESKSSLSHCK